MQYEDQLAFQGLQLITDWLTYSLLGHFVNTLYQLI